MNEVNIHGTQWHECVESNLVTMKSPCRSVSSEAGFEDTLCLSETKCIPECRTFRHNHVDNQYVIKWLILEGRLTCFLDICFATNGNTLEPHERFLKYRVLLFLRAPIVTIIFSIKHPVRIWCFSLYVLSWWFLICRTSYAIQLRTWDLSHLLLLLLMYLFIRFDSWDEWFSFHQVKYSNVYQFLIINDKK